MSSQSSPVKSINLALQGGGAHGAFTWGVLDRLLEDERLRIDGISGTSAGSMNAAALAAGFAKGGAEGARRELHDFWEQVSRASRHGFLRRTWADRLFAGWNLDHSPAFVFFDLLTHFFAPWQLNPFNVNPLKDIVDKLIDIPAARRCSDIKLFISATNVRTGKIRVFEGAEVSVDVLLASACLPFVFRAVKIDGEPYWDGGYMGNPAIYPLIYNCASPDVVIVQVNPLTRDKEPMTASEIIDRVNEISFNSTLMREMRAIEFVSRLIEEERLDPQRYRRIHVHWIGAETAIGDLGVATKLNADWDFLLHLRDIGRTLAEAWLRDHFDKIGRRSSVDVREKFL